MRARLTPCLLLTSAVLLSGCASPAAPTTAPSGTPDTATPAATTPAPTPTPQDELIVGIDGVTYEHDGVADEFLFEGAGEAEDLLVAIEELTGRPRTGEDIEGPYGGYWGTSYTWDGVKVIVAGEHADRVNVAVTAPAIGGVPIVTEDGELSVGSSREDAVAAGARDGWDADSDGIADWLEVGELEVPGTNSLVNPGGVGIMFVLLGLTGDTITEIQSPGNDFSDM
ncbi:hypothetical protein JNB63_04415 [Microbacterium trichothecenolyticum]|uniref:Uncharacterized protein n=1 Tax=Microbacterium ureisolvens TaxID=2781186 RepID=A0ABS7HXC5_9MICO|nr:MULTISPECIES: hypothetical protein [Microbacterium]MBW9110031.1 hypothetical protein [Microbacterium ureisolvens]MBW9119328.1 hypothetical protein [Microbacterium trichothecenolyticum]